LAESTTYTVTLHKSIRRILELKKGDLTYLEVDEKGRIIYEPLSPP